MSLFYKIVPYTTLELGTFVAQHFTSLFYMDFHFLDFTFAFVAIYQTLKHCDVCIVEQPCRETNELFPLLLLRQSDILPMSIELRQQLPVFSYSHQSRRIEGLLQEYMGEADPAKKRASTVWW